MQESIYVDRFLFHKLFFRLQAFCYYNASLRFGVLHPNVTDMRYLRKVVSMYS